MFKPVIRADYRFVEARMASRGLNRDTVIVARLLRFARLPLTISCKVMTFPIVGPLHLQCLITCAIVLSTYSDQVMQNERAACAH